MKATIDRIITTKKIDNCYDILAIIAESEKESFMMAYIFSGCKIRKNVKIDTYEGGNCVVMRVCPKNKN